MVKSVIAVALKYGHDNTVFHHQGMTSHTEPLALITLFDVYPNLVRIFICFLTFRTRKQVGGIIPTNSAWLMFEYDGSGGAYSSVHCCPSWSEDSRTTRTLPARC